jgi:hypothetical protein
VATRAEGHFPSDQLAATRKPVGSLLMAAKGVRQGIAWRCRRVAPALSLC